MAETQLRKITALDTTQKPFILQARLDTKRKSRGRYKALGRNVEDEDEDDDDRPPRAS
jgi:hypothetical protein